VSRAAVQFVQEPEAFSLLWLYLIFHPKNTINRTAPALTRATDLTLFRGVWL